MAGHQGGVESKLRSAMAERVGEAKFGLWFGEGVRLGVDGDALDRRRPEPLLPRLDPGEVRRRPATAGQAVAGRRLRLDFEVADEPDPASAT